MSNGILREREQKRKKEREATQACEQSKGRCKTLQPVWQQQQQQKTLHTECNGKESAQ